MVRWQQAKYLFGGVGTGTNVKLVVNMVMGTMMGAFSEGLALAREADIDAAKLLEVLDLGAMSNPMFRLKGPKMLANDHAPNFPLKHAQKDMKCVPLKRLACLRHSHRSTCIPLFLHLCVCYCCNCCCCCCCLRVLRLALALAEQKGLALPTTQAANALMLQAMNEKGAADDDFSATYKALDK